MKEKKIKYYNYSKLLKNIDNITNALSLIFPLIKNLGRFPMRKLPNGLSEKHFSYESLVKENYHKNRCNLFSLCISPNYYFEKGQKDFYNDYIAYKFWIESLSMDEEILNKLWSKKIIQNCIDTKLVSIVKDSNINKVSPEIRIIPFNNTLFLTDKYDRSNKNMVYLSYDSIVLSALILKYDYYGQNICDICCGSGILGIIAAQNSMQHNESCVVHGIDLNNCAIECAKLNHALNHIYFKGYNISYLASDELIRSSDLITFNPPYIYGPASKGSLDSDGGQKGIQHTVGILDKIHKHLKIGKAFIGISQTPVIEGEDILWQAIHQFEMLKINYVILDEFEHLDRDSKWYKSNGVNSFKQVLIHGKKTNKSSKKNVNNVQNGKYCFA